MSDEFSEIIEALRNLPVEATVPKELSDRFGRYMDKNVESVTAFVSQLQLLFVVHSAVSPPMDRDRLGIAMADIRGRAGRVELSRIFQEMRVGTSENQVPTETIERIKFCIRRFPGVAGVTLCDLFAEEMLLRNPSLVEDLSAEALRVLVTGLRSVIQQA